MTGNPLPMIWIDGTRAMCNHLWQSTLFAGVIFLLTLILRKYQARTRYWLWMAASVKLLIPFSLIAVIVSRAKWMAHGSQSQTATFAAIHQMSQPFTDVADLSAPISSLAASPAAKYPIALFVFLLIVAWLLGFLAVLTFWILQWRRVSKSARAARPLEVGREFEALRRMERIFTLPRPMEIASSLDSMEPGVFGVLRPVLLWPEGISRHLDDAHLEAVLAHEVCHVRWRDNLTSMVHMLVSAIFWFHPLVWWMEKQLVKERELACDEDVVHLFKQPQVYAESILKVCEFCIESPLPCVSGITGSDLKKRVKQIMTGRIGQNLSLGKKLLLLAVVLGSAASGVLTLGVRPSLAQTVDDVKLPLYAVVSIKQNKDGGIFTIDYTDDTGYFKNLPLQVFLSDGYRIPQNLISGMPSWGSSERYDIQAKVAEADVAAFKKLKSSQKALMLQPILAERFKLKAHTEMKELPEYALVVAKNGSKLRDAKKNPDGTPMGFGTRSTAPGRFVGEGASMKSLLAILSEPNMGVDPGRPIIDQTGLAGSYDFTLNFAPPDQASTEKDDRPSLFTALEEQLGLKLEPRKGSIKTLVVDSVERPSQN